MKYLQTYKSFIYGHHVNEGLRITAGIALPVFVMSYFDLQAIGIVMAIGALGVSGTDTPGPLHHRSNAMLVCNILIFFTAIVIGFAFHSALILGIILFILCFLFSMLGVYGNRESAIGIAALLVMVLNLQYPKKGWEIILNALYILAGGVWYMLFSLALYRLRPYKLIQQLLGDYIQSTADYLRGRAAFYDKDVAYDDTNTQLLPKQVHVQEIQNTVSEMLFKTREIVKESSSTGRTLVMAYLDVTDIFEHAMTSYQQYNVLHEYFDSTGIMEEIRKVLLQLADELYEVGIAVKSGASSQANWEIAQRVKEIRKHFGELRVKVMNADNLDGFVSLGRIVDAVEDFSARITVLHQYTGYKTKRKKRPVQKISYNKLVDHKSIEPQVFFDNLNFGSNIFRHSLRVSVAVMAGYIISLLFKTGHSYWILLTIIVILKPAYSLTKNRNRDRLIGTLCGVAIGVSLIFLIKNETVLLVLMILFMTGCFIFLRTNYFIGVLLMTPYLLIFFHLLYPENFRILLTDRIIDTAIGSAIAFITSIFLVPAWEHTTIKAFMIKMLENSRAYYQAASDAFIHESAVAFDQLHLARKNAFVALANLSDAFNRMLSEPRRYQKEAEKVHRFVVLNHTLASHIATLSYYLQTREMLYRSPALAPVIKETIAYFSNAIASMESGTTIAIPPEKQSLRALNEEAEALMEKRRLEIEQGLLETRTKTLLVQTKSVTDQFNYIYKIAVDVNKLCSEINLS